MKHLLPILLCALCLVACKEQNPPSGGGTNPEPAPNPSVSFTFTVRPPYTVQFTNTSTDIRNFKWDFGDSKTSTETNPTHVYSAFGTYTVRLTGKFNTETYTAKATVTLKEPEVYITGYSITQIPYENKYYRVMIHNGSEGYQYNWTPLLKSADLPYTVHANQRLHLVDFTGDKYYWLQVNYSSSTATTGTQCLKVKVDAEFVRTWYDAEWYYYSDFNDGVWVTLYFEYE